MFSQKIRSSGFTLIELMVTIGIMMILLIGISQVNFAPRISKENLSRFSGTIISYFNTQRMGNLSGKQVTIGTTTSSPTYSAVHIGPNTIDTRFYSGSIASINTAISTPFFGDSFYKILQMDLVQKDGTTLSGSGITLDVLFDPITKNLSFSGTDGSSTYGNEYVLAVIHMEYKTYKQRVNIDRRTGRIEARDE